jgi:hypothetical protein
VPDCRQNSFGTAFYTSEPLTNFQHQIYFHLASLEHLLCGAGVAVRGLLMLSADLELDAVLREEVKL